MAATHAPLSPRVANRFTDRVDHDAPTIPPPASCREHVPATEQPEECPPTERAPLSAPFGGFSPVPTSIRHF